MSTPVFSKSAVDASGGEAGDRPRKGASAEARQELADPELHREILAFARRRVSGAEADDVLQTVLCEALASERAPAERKELRKWVMGIARHKVADVHRRGVRDKVDGSDPVDMPDRQTSTQAPAEQRALVEWAEKEATSGAQSVRDAEKTLEWMAREGDGEKLESIAAVEGVPPARVRQRVSRMRRFMKQRWLAELAAAAAAAVLIAIWLYRNDDQTDRIVEVEPPVEEPVEEGRRLRADGLSLCENGAWERCLEQLDRAKKLDPDGDGAPAVERARKQAAEALSPIQNDNDQQKDAPNDQQKDSDGENEKTKDGESKLDATPMPTTLPPIAPPPKPEPVDLKTDPMQAPSELDSSPTQKPLPPQTQTQEESPQQQAPPETKIAPKKAPSKKLQMSDPPIQQQSWPPPQVLKK